MQVQESGQASRDPHTPGGFFPYSEHTNEQFLPGINLLESLQVWKPPIFMVPHFSIVINTLLLTPWAPLAELLLYWLLEYGSLIQRPNPKASSIIVIIVFTTMILDNTHIHACLTTTLTTNYMSLL